MAKQIQSKEDKNDAEYERIISEILVEDKAILEAMDYSKRK